MVDATTVSLVQGTWAMVSGDSEGVAAIFYNNLFTMYPELPETLFKGTDMRTQRKSLIAMLDAAVKNLTNLDVLIPTLQGLGVRHAGYGCEECHYDMVGGALLKTLGDALGEKWTPEVKTAWMTVYGVIMSTMVDAQNTEEGKKLFAAYQAKHKKCCCSAACPLVVVGAVVAVAAAFWYFKKQ